MRPQAETHTRLCGGPERGSVTSVSLSLSSGTGLAILGPTQERPFPLGHLLPDAPSGYRGWSILQCLGLACVSVLRPVILLIRVITGVGGSQAILVGPLVGSCPSLTELPHPHLCPAAWSCRLPHPLLGAGTQAALSFLHCLLIAGLWYRPGGAPVLVSTSLLPRPGSKPTHPHSQTKPALSLHVHGHFPFLNLFPKPLPVVPGPSSAIPVSPFSWPGSGVPSLGCPTKLLKRVRHPTEAARHSFLRPIPYLCSGRGCLQPEETPTVVDQRDI